MAAELTLTVFGLLCGGALATVLSVQPTGCRVPGAGEAAERLLTIEELVAEFDHMLIRKGLMTGAQLALIRHGRRSRGVVTGMRTTGGRLEDCCEVVLDLMVSRVGGGQFPVRETVLIPACALAKVMPGSVIDAYYRPGDESTIAVCVPPA